MSTNQVSMKDVWGQAKSSTIAVMGVMPKAIESATNVLDSVTDLSSVLQNQTKRVRAESDAMQVLYDLLPVLTATRAYRKVGEAKRAISLLERALDGEELTDEEYDELDAIEKLLS